MAERISAKGNYASWLVLVSSLATLGIAICNFLQLQVMKNTLGIMEESTRFAQMPRMELMLGPESDDKPYVEQSPGPEGTRLRLWYYINNTSANVASDFKYNHQMTQDSTIDWPDAKLFSERYKALIIGPNDRFNCGYDPAYLQEIIDNQKLNKPYFRYLFVEYTDEAGRDYRYKAKWQLSYDEVNKVFSFSPLENRQVRD